MSVDGHKIAEAVVFASCSGRKPDSQKQSLLDNQYQYGRNKESCKPCRRVEHGYIFIFYRISCNLVLSVGSISATRNLDILVHIKRNRRIEIGRASCRERV